MKADRPRRETPFHSTEGVAKQEKQPAAQREHAARLQQELEEARRLNSEAAHTIELLEREKAEILCVLESINRSTGFELLKRYRSLKNRLLPPGTLRRRWCDRWLSRLANSAQSADSPPRHAEAETIESPPAAPGSYASRLELLDAPAVMSASQAGTVLVRVANLSRCAWAAERRAPSWQGTVRISYHWYDQAGKIAQWEGERTNLPHDLGPGESADARMRVFAPFTPGSYTLEITLLREGFAWFDQKGNKTIRVPVRVESVSGGPQASAPCSIIIPVFNRAAFTRACLLAIEKSVSPELPHEVIVVDNGSNDQTPQLLRSWCASHSNARVISMGQNLGFACACNEGARLARGRYLVFLNNDTLPTPGWLQNMIRCAQSELRIGIVGSKLLFPDGRVQHIGMAFDELRNPRHIYRGFPAHIPPAGISREYQSVTGACLLIERELHWSVGGLDEAYENSCEDVDLCLKVRSRGYRVLFCADSVVYHFQSLSEGRNARDLRNLALLKARWGNRIESDAKSWCAKDSLEDERTQFEPHQGYHPNQEKQLEKLWEQIYACPLPAWESYASLR